MSCECLGLETGIRNIHTFSVIILGPTKPTHLHTCAHCTMHIYHALPVLLSMHIFSRGGSRLITFELFAATVLTTNFLLLIFYTCFSFILLQTIFFLYVYQIHSKSQVYSTLFHMKYTIYTNSYIQISKLYTNDLSMKNIFSLIYYYLVIHLNKK